VALKGLGQTCAMLSHIADFRLTQRYAAAIVRAPRSPHSVADVSEKHATYIFRVQSVLSKPGLLFLAWLALPGRKGQSTSVSAVPPLRRSAATSHSGVPGSRKGQVMWYLWWIK
jgi:hypothetical protein